MPLKGFSFRRSDHVQNLRQKRERVDSKFRSYQIPREEMSAIFEKRKFETNRRKRVDVDVFVGMSKEFGDRPEMLRDVNDDSMTIDYMIQNILSEEWNENVHEISRISSRPIDDTFVPFYNEIETIDTSSNAYENTSSYLSLSESSLSIKANNIANGIQSIPKMTNYFKSCKADVVVSKSLERVPISFLEYKSRNPLRNKKEKINIDTFASIPTLVFDVPSFDDETKHIDSSKESISLDFQDTTIATFPLCDFIHQVSPTHTSRPLRRVFKKQAMSSDGKWMTYIRSAFETSSLISEYKVDVISMMACSMFKSIRSSNSEDEVGCLVPIEMNVYQNKGMTVSRKKNNKTK